MGRGLAPVDESESCWRRPQRVVGLPGRKWQARQGNRPALGRSHGAPPGARARARLRPTRNLLLVLALALGSPQLHHLCVAVHGVRWGSRRSVTSKMRLDSAHGALWRLSVGFGSAENHGVLGSIQVLPLKKVLQNVEKLEDSGNRTGAHLLQPGLSRGLRPSPLPPHRPFLGGRGGRCRG